MPITTLVRFRFLLLLAAFAGFYNCTPGHLKPTAEEQMFVDKFRSSLSPEYTNFRIVAAELKLEVTNIQSISEDSLKSLNSLNGLPPKTQSSMLIWSSDIRNYATQKLLQQSKITPEPDTTFSDSAFGNQILYWDLSTKNKGKATISRSFKYLTYDFRAEVDRVAEQQNWHLIPQEISEGYTRAERFLEQEDALIDTVFHLLADVPDPVSQAEVIYDWIQKSMTYVYPPEKRGVVNAFKTLKGDCGQYSALFITMARIAGIPARQQSGFNFIPGNTGAHVWSEIYLPIKGWVPVDATRKDGFLHLDNGRLITSLGLNIPLVNAPDWANFQNSEVENGKTDFMQMFTLASHGMSADFNSTRRIIYSIEIP